MNTPQKFFGFLLLPILTFILGFSLKDQIQPSSEKFFSGESAVNLEEVENQINIDLLRTAYQKWKEQASSSDERTLEELASTISKTEQLITHLKEINLDMFWEALGEIEEKYVDPEKLDLQKISEGAIRGMVFSLGDPYSSYLSREESEYFDAELAGELEGIGAELTMKDGLVTVVSPLKDSPASRAGILPEDIIIKVDGEGIETQSLGEVVEKIRGEVGTQVTLTLLRQNQPEPMEKIITREHIVVESVHLEIRDGIAILEINQFGDNTDEEFRKYLRDAISKNPTGIILDLRFNPGGYLETAVQMVSTFVKEGKVVVQKERAPSVVNRFVNGKVLTDLPLVVLINRGSASAAEIVAGALQDHGRAIILGETSFGKGTVQEILPLSDGSNLRLTIAKWLTPKGRDISEKGIEPDIHIERTLEDFTEDRDPQLEAALKILKGEASVEELGGMKEGEIGDK